MRRSLLETFSPVYRSSKRKISVEGRGGLSVVHIWSMKFSSMATSVPGRDVESDCCSEYGIRVGSMPTREEADSSCMLVGEAVTCNDAPS